MKIFFGLGVTLALAAFACAQFGGSGALGGPFASRGISRPLGGIGPRNPNLPSPALPGGIRGTGRPLGVYAFPFAYSTYVPNYFSTPDYDYWSTQQAPALQPQAPPVIINQYFGSLDSSAQAAPSNAPNNNLNTYQAPSAPYPTGPNPSEQTSSSPGDPIGPAQNYYLIAYKDHSVYPVLAYWLEGDTLHYVTTQNTHNQASINLIDMDLTKTLNQARGVPFTVSGR